MLPALDFYVPTSVRAATERDRRVASVARPRPHLHAGHVLRGMSVEGRRARDTRVGLGCRRDDARVDELVAVAGEIVDTADHALGPRLHLLEADGRLGLASVALVLVVR